MVGIVIVSHSAMIADGVRELSVQMADAHDGIIACGGLEDGDLGTDANRIAKAIREANDGDGVVVLADIGSGVMSAQMAIELLANEDIDVRLADAPLVEGAVAAAITAVCGSSINTVFADAEQARFVKKINS